MTVYPLKKIIVILVHNSFNKDLLVPTICQAMFYELRIQMWTNGQIFRHVVYV